MKHLNKGFSLLEVLVAFSLFALTIGALLEIFTSTRASVIRSESYTDAAIIANTQLARVDVQIPLEESQLQDETKSGYHWLIHITPFEIDENITTPYAVWLIDIDVSWNQTREKPSHYQIKTLRVSKKHR